MFDVETMISNHCEASVLEPQSIAAFLAKLGMPRWINDKAAVHAVARHLLLTNIHHNEFVSEYTESPIGFDLAESGPVDPAGRSKS